MLFVLSLMLAADGLTLRDAVRIAVEQHPDVRMAQAGADALKGRIREVRAQALPEVSLVSNAIRWRDPSLLNASGIDKFPVELRNALVPTAVNLFDYSLTVKQPIYTAGKVGTALKLAAVEAEAASAEIDRAQQDLALSVTRAFYSLLWVGRYQNVVVETQQQRKLHADMAQVRYRNGVATEVDVLRSNVSVANGQPDLVRAANAIHQARALLNYYLARPASSPTDAQGDLEEKPWDEWDLDKLAAEAYRRRPELVRLRFAERSARVQIDLARAESRMRVDFAAGYGVMARLPENLMNGDFTRWNAALNFTFPVFDGYKRSGRVWQATAQERAARAGREKAEQEIRLALQQGLDELKAARETIAAARATAGQAEKVLAMTQNNYKFGAATTLDIADAQTALLVARTNLLRGQYDYAIARATLLWCAGRAPWE